MFKVYIILYLHLKAIDHNILDILLLIQYHVHISVCVFQNMRCSISGVFNMACKKLDSSDLLCRLLTNESQYLRVLCLPLNNHTGRIDAMTVHTVQGIVPSVNLGVYLKLPICVYRLYVLSMPTRISPASITSRLTD